jgi:hypothetical protein
MGNASALAGLLLLFGAASASPASAQTVTVEGAYAKLSPGNAKIARALFEAQVTNTMPSPTSMTAAGPAPKSLTVDQIAAMKQNGQGWGQVFQSMKGQGRLTDKNLGQVVSRYQHRNSSAVVTTTSKKSADGAISASYDGDAGKSK